MIVKEIAAKTILSKSAIQDYALNAYVGCQHDCRYCYARFMKRFTGHAEPWGTFVDVKVNAPELLAREILRKKKGRVWVSGVCDAYQPLESEVPAHPALPRDPRRARLAGHGPDEVPARAARSRPPEARRRTPRSASRSPPRTSGCGGSSSRAPRRSPGGSRRWGRSTRRGSRPSSWSPRCCPAPRGSRSCSRARSTSALIDRYNYHYADRTYREHGLRWAMTEEFFQEKGEKLRAAFEQAGIPCRML